MYKKPLLLLLLSLMAVCVLNLSSAQQEDDDLPSSLIIAAKALRAQSDDKIDVLNNLENYSFSEKLLNINIGCMSKIYSLETPDILVTTVTFTIKLPDGSRGDYIYRVSSKPVLAPAANDRYVNNVTGAYFVNADGRVALMCKQDVTAPTMTPTVDLTQTTATPTITPSPTYTPSLTYTPSKTYTPSLTYTPSKTLTPSNTPSNTPTATNTLTPTPTFTNTPSVTPRAEDVITCPGFLTSRLFIGELANVLDEPLRLRSEPATTGRPIALLDAKAEFGVLEGPECDPAGRAWWKVQYSAFTGWLIEGEGEEYYTEPQIGETFDTPTPLPPTRTPAPTRTGTHVAVTCPGFMVSRLIPGEIGLVLPGDANNVRDIPAASGNLIGKIPGGEEFYVLDGPECDPAGRAWWQVDYNGIVGWTVEGQGEEYYLEPVAP